MGYYTYYTLGVHKKKHNVNCPEVTVDFEIEKKVAVELAKIIYEIDDKPNEQDIKYLAEVEERGIYTVLNDSMKWYEHEGEMCKLSAMFPDLYFTLEGDGEEFDDFWRKLFHNGQCIGSVDGEIYYPEFDINYWEDGNAEPQETQS
jgi:hypothetical protein